MGDVYRILLFKHSARCQHMLLEVQSRSTRALRPEEMRHAATATQSDLTRLMSQRDAKTALDMQSQIEAVEEDPDSNLQDTTSSRRDVVQEGGQRHQHSP